VGVLVEVERVNEGEKGEGIGLMGFTYIYKIEKRNLLQCFKWGREWGEMVGCDLTNVQCKAIQNCHNESPIQQTYPIKNEKKYIYGNFPSWSTPHLM
jgi:hypothetical protein